MAWTEVLPLLWVLGPLAGAVAVVACRSAIQAARARARAENSRALLGEPRRVFEPTLDDHGRAATLVGRLRARGKPDAWACALSWLEKDGDALHLSTTRDWCLEPEKGDAIELEGALAVITGSEEIHARGLIDTEAFDVVSIQRDGARKLGIERLGLAHAVQQRDLVRVHGTLVVEHAPEAAGYRARSLSVRLVALDGAILVAAEEGLRVRETRWTATALVMVSLGMALGGVPALWMMRRDHWGQDAYCERKLDEAEDARKPWYAETYALECGDDPQTAHIAWENASMKVASKRAWWRADDPAAAAAHIMAGNFDDAAETVRLMMSSRNAYARALECLALGLEARGSERLQAIAGLRRGAEIEQDVVVSSTWRESDPVTCAPLLADLLGDMSILQPLLERFADVLEGVSYPRFYDLYLAVLLHAEHNELLENPLLQRVVLDMGYPVSALEDPRSWALTLPMGVATGLMERANSEEMSTKRPPLTKHVVGAALSAQRALFDAYMGETRLADQHLRIVERLAERDDVSHLRLRGIFMLAAAVAILTGNLVVAERMLEAGRDDTHGESRMRRRLILLRGAGDWAGMVDHEPWSPNAELWRASNSVSFIEVLTRGPLSGVHRVLPYVWPSQPEMRGALQDWVEEAFPPLCQQCGVRALAEHLASRRLVANLVSAKSVSRHLERSADRLHTQLVRRDIAVPLYLLARITEP